MMPHTPTSLTRERSMHGFCSSSEKCCLLMRYQRLALLFCFFILFFLSPFKVSDMRKNSWLTWCQTALWQCAACFVAGSPGSTSKFNSKFLMLSSVSSNVQSVKMQIYISSSIHKDITLYYDSLKWKRGTRDTTWQCNTSSVYPQTEVFSVSFSFQMLIYWFVSNH